MWLYVYGFGEKLQKISKKINRFSQWQRAEKHKKRASMTNHAVKSWLESCEWWEELWDTRRSPGRMLSLRSRGINDLCRYMLPIIWFLHKDIASLITTLKKEKLLQEATEGDAACGVPPPGEVVPQGILCQLVFGGAGMLLWMIGGSHRRNICCHKGIVGWYEWLQAKLSASVYGDPQDWRRAV